MVAGWRLAAERAGACESLRATGVISRHDSHALCPHGGTHERTPAAASAPALQTWAPPGAAGAAVAKPHPSAARIAAHTFASRSACEQPGKRCCPPSPIAGIGAWVREGAVVKHGSTSCQCGRMGGGAAGALLFSCRKS
eukprot:TRINITY_DN35414_c0_g1_i1.p2 TRINITY_DN35414_c0_g1~~TRINITY_DN35414_c0_g1_i1.p2  ORF type:complete len:153 (+),score=31.91 TRINITY_DN35414_c0_g1_i1:43-459(+)